MRNLLRFLADYSVAIIGFSITVFAVFANDIAAAFGHGPPGKMQIVTGLIGLMLFAIGVFKKRIFSAYASAVIMVANTLLILLVLELGASFINRSEPLWNLLAGQADDSGQLAPSDRLPANDTRAMQAVKAFKARPKFYSGWDGEPLSREFLTVGPDGLRTTPSNSSQSSSKPIKLFAFGGSTMWGEGAADHRTIPAYLSNLLSAQSGHNVQATNFGQRGWVSTQSLVRLIRELQQGNIPDVVVFYDGYNDPYSSVSTGQSGMPEDAITLLIRLESVGQHLANKVLATSDIVRLIVRFIDPQETVPMVDVEKLSQDVADTYFNVYRIVGALATAYDFEWQFYWQPILIRGNKRLSSTEQQIRSQHAWLSKPVREVTHASYDLVAKLASEHPNLTDISDTFDQLTERVYYDPCHVSGVGNQLVAQRMLDQGLLDAVNRRVKSRQPRNE